MGGKRRSAGVTVKPILLEQPSLLLEQPSRPPRDSAGSQDSSAGDCQVIAEAVAHPRKSARLQVREECSAPDAAEPSTALVTVSADAIDADVEYADGPAEEAAPLTKPALSRLSGKARRAPVAVGIADDELDWLLEAVRTGLLACGECGGRLVARNGRFGLFFPCRDCPG